MSGRGFSAIFLATGTFNPYLPSELVHPYQLDKSISKFMGVRCIFSFLYYFEYKFMQANSEDPDQTPRSAASNLGLYCLPRSQKMGRLA